MPWQCTTTGAGAAYNAGVGAVYASTGARARICVGPPLCREPSQGTCGLRIIELVCEGETVGKIGEVEEMGQRELVLVLSVKCGKEGDMTRG